jgi:hypothetical protein
VADDLAPDDQDDAARAFADMGAELAVLRRAVETFDAKLEGVKARDYDATLGAIREALGATSTRLDAIAAAPAMSLTPDQWTRQVQAVGEAARREGQVQLEAARREVAAAALQLQGLVAQAATAEIQFRWQLIWGGAGVALGMLLAVMGVVGLGAFPASWSLKERTAALVMREDRWTAGLDIARSADPTRLDSILAGSPANVPSSGISGRDRGRGAHHPGHRRTSP